jgi:hypothetical protein
MSKMQHPVIFSFGDLRIDSEDDFKMVGSGGVISAHVRRSNGDVHSIRVWPGGRLKEYRRFDARDLTIDQRRALVETMYEKAYTQAEIADQLGVSQATVSLDLKRLKEERQTKPRRLSGTSAASGKLRLTARRR